MERPDQVSKHYTARRHVCCGSCCCGWRCLTKLLGPLLVLFMRRQSQPPSHREIRILRGGSRFLWDFVGDACGVGNCVTRRSSFSTSFEVNEQSACRFHTVSSCRSKTTCVPTVSIRFRACPLGRNDMVDVSGRRHSEDHHLP
eukprot:gene25508-biopygen7501